MNKLKNEISNTYPLYCIKLQQLKKIKRDYREQCILLQKLNTKTLVKRKLYIKIITYSQIIKKIVKVNFIVMYYILKYGFYY